MIVPRWCATVQLCQVPGGQKRIQRGDWRGQLLKKTSLISKFFLDLALHSENRKEVFFLFLSPTLLGPCEDPEFRPIILVLKFYLVSQLIDLVGKHLLVKQLTYNVSFVSWTLFAFLKNVFCFCKCCRVPCSINSPPVGGPNTPGLGQGKGSNPTWKVLGLL